MRAAEVIPRIVYLFIFAFDAVPTRLITHFQTDPSRANLLPIVGMESIGGAIERDRSEVAESRHIIMRKEEKEEKARRETER